MKRAKSENVKKLAFCLGVLVFLFTSASAANGQTRIRFARGATSAVVSGRLLGYKDGKTFVIKVRAGQTLRTAQIGSSHNITIFIESPDGEGVGDSDASCNNRREITPTYAGDYKIRVVQCQKADEWRGSFRFRVTVR